MLVKDKARLDAAEVLNETWAVPGPVDPERIANHIGIVVRRVPLEPGISGILRVEPGLDPVIFINDEDSPQRQRFTIAHELGHYYERNSAGQDDYNIVERLRGGKYDLHEFYADEFAGALLMPTRDVNRLRDSGASVLHMARAFDVSMEAMKKRLARLEL